MIQRPSVAKSCLQRIACHTLRDFVLDLAFVFAGLPDFGPDLVLATFNFAADGALGPDFADATLCFTDAFTSFFNVGT